MFFVATIVFGLQPIAQSCEAYDPYWLMNQRRLLSPFDYRNYSKHDFRIFPRFEWQDRIDLFVTPVAYSAMPSLYKFHYQEMQLPHGAVFCRMETYTQKKLGVMFSIHAGGYKERY